MTTENTQMPIYEYPSFPRRFISYRWFKPILVGVLGFGLMLVFQIIMLFGVMLLTHSTAILDSAGEGYEGMDVFTAPGAFFELGAIGVMLAALALAALVVRDRPWSSYSSSRGGWNWGAFGKCLLVAFVVVGGASVAFTFLFPSEEATGIVRFTIAGFIVCTLLTPFQCIAEEYMFRGYILQTVGSWVKFPVIAIVVQALAFAAGHPYNDIGVFSIFCNGIITGILAWRTCGLEASSASHIANNMTGFYLVGFGLDVISSEVDVFSCCASIAVDVIYAVVILAWGKKRGWFSSKGDGARKYNERRIAQLVRKNKPLRFPPIALPVATSVPVAVATPVLVPARSALNSATIPALDVAPVVGASPAQGGERPLVSVPAGAQPPAPTARRIPRHARPEDIES